MSISKKNSSTFNPEVWGPHYWFFIHTMAFTYPIYPTSMTKKKYYEFIHSLPLFIPVESISKNFAKLLDKYPVTPYLDNRDTFLRWTHFIHNKINQKLEKPKISFKQFYNQYHQEYKTNNVKMMEYTKLRRHITYVVLIVLLFIFIYYIQFK